jgi:leader peptidase (prepilin peptidase)/N-methyltransferase
MFAVLIGAAGFFLGPILSVIVDSVPDSSGGGRGFNTCGACGRTHGAIRFVPLLGPRECAECGTSTSPSLFVLPLVTAAIFGIVAVQVGSELVIIPLLGFVAALIALSTVDIIRYRLPDRLLFPSLAALIPVILIVSVIDDKTAHLWPAAIAALAYFVLLLVPNLISPGGLAFGDVKLALLLGLFLGWTRSAIGEGLALVFYALILGMLLGIVSGLGVGVGRRIWGPTFLEDPDVPLEERNAALPILKTQFPFGPALAAAALIVMLTSENLLGSPGLL